MSATRDITQFRRGIGIVTQVKRKVGSFPKPIRRPSADFADDARRRPARSYGGEATRAERIGRSLRTIRRFPKWTTDGCSRLNLNLHCSYRGEANLNLYLW